MIGLALLTMLSTAEPALAQDKQVCRGVFMQNGSQPFVLINLKISGDPTSLGRIRIAAGPIASKVSDEIEDGKSVLYLSFFSDKDPNKIDSLWTQIEKGDFGKLSAKPFMMPMTMITPEHPCFGRLIAK